MQRGESQARSAPWAVHPGARGVWGRRAVTQQSPNKGAATTGSTVRGGSTGPVCDGRDLIRDGWRWPGPVPWTGVWGRNLKMGGTCLAVRGPAEPHSRAAGQGQGGAAAGALGGQEDWTGAEEHWDRDGDWGLGRDQTRISKPCLLPEQARPAREGAAVSGGTPVVAWTGEAIAGRRKLTVLKY